MSEMQTAKDYLASFGIQSEEITTVEHWQFLNADDCWIDANPSSPEQSARDNASYFGTYRVRSREVTYTEWKES